VGTGPGSECLRFLGVVPAAVAFIVLAGIVLVLAVRVAVTVAVGAIGCGETLTAC
jgi:hypothetical protein